MIELQRESPSEAYTRTFARALASILRSGDVLTLSGELGSGKTTFVRALAEALGIDTRLVSSPTFVLMNIYRRAPRAPVEPHAPGAGSDRTSPVRTGPDPTDPDRTLTSLVHVDAYRLGAEDELDLLGWDQAFEPESGRAVPGAAAVIEWPERLSAWRRPADLAELCFAHLGPTRRHITLRVPDSWAGRAGLRELQERMPARCPITGAWVEPTRATYPFRDAHARDADLGRWLSGAYRIGGGHESEPPEAPPPPARHGRSVTPGSRRRGRSVRFTNRLMLRCAPCSAVACAPPRPRLDTIGG